MALSSNSIIHFTKDLKSLEGILLETFKIRYCRETLYDRDGNFDILVPIVSFCDIPFSQILNHITSYGSYGIGLSKSWAERQGLNPVLYVDKNSNIAANFFSHFFHPDLWGEKEIEKFTLEKKKVFDIIRYMKNYQGDLYRLKAKKPLKDYRFSDEREWRFVLPVSSKNPMLINCVDKKTDQIIELKRDSNQSIEYERLQFGPDDINYIIIKTEKERDSIIARLPQIKDGHDKNSVARLSSRIISVQQIKSDF